MPKFLFSRVLQLVSHHSFFFHFVVQPDFDIQKQLAIFGFVLYCIMTLPSTEKRIKEFPPEHQVAVLLTVGFIWTLSFTGARCCIYGRTSLEHTVANLAVCVGMLGLTLLSYWIYAASELLEERGRAELVVCWRFSDFGTFGNCRPQHSIFAGKFHLLFFFIVWTNILTG